MRKQTHKFYTKKYGKKRIHIWNSESGAKSDLRNLKERGYKVKLSPDKKSVIVIGKTTRGIERDVLGRRAIMSPTMRRPTIPGLPQMKPYGVGYSSFRQPCFTLRRMGWSA